MGLRIRHRDIRPTDLTDAVLNRQPDRGEYLAAGIVNAFHDMPLLGANMDRNGIALAEGDPQGSLMEWTRIRKPVPTLTPEEQKASPDYRESMGVVEGATAGSMQYRAEQTDARAWRDQLIAKRDAGVGDSLLMFGAQMIGGAPDPINYVPFVGAAFRAAFLARAGTRAAWLMRGAAVGAFEGAVGNLAAAPFTANLFASRGRDYGMEDLAADLVFGAAAGGTFGGFGAAMEGRPARVADAARIEPPRPMLEAPSPLPNVLGDLTARDAVPVERAAPPSTADGFVFGFGSRENAPPAPRMADAAKAAESMELATHQVVDGEHVDVGKLAPRPATPDPLPGFAGTDAPYEFRPMASDEASGRTFYHGTKAPIDKLSQVDVFGFSDAGNFYGEGLYLTDKKAVSTEYANRGKGTPGKVLSAKLNDVKLLNLEDQLTPDTVQPFLAEFERIHGENEDVTARLLDMTGVQAYDELRRTLRADGISKNEMVDVLGEMSAAFGRMGYDGLHHIDHYTPGAKDGQNHNVVVLFEDAGHDAQGNPVGRGIKGKLTDLPADVAAVDVTRPGMATEPGGPLSDTSRGTPIPDDDAAMKAELRQPAPDLMEKARKPATETAATRPAAVDRVSSPIEIDGGNFTKNIVDDSGAVVGFIKGTASDTEFRIQETGIEATGARGKGYASRAYQQLADEVLAQGKTLRSDMTVTDDAAKLYEGLQKRGYTVEKSPNLIRDQMDGTGFVSTADATAVYRVTAGPEKAQAPANAAGGLIDGEFPEVADFKLRLEQGRVHPDDLAAFRAADAEFDRMGDIEKAFDVASACVIRSLGL